MFEDDDWLNPPQQGGTQDPLVEQEYTRIASKYTDAGYREGITDGKLSTLQQGFDEAFTQSVPLSRRVGALRGRAAALLAFIKASSSSSSPSSTPIPTSTSYSQQALFDDLHDYIKQISSIRRSEVLPEDLERIAHEREDHAAAASNGVFELDTTDEREMDCLEKSLEMFGSSLDPKANQGDGGKEEGKKYEEEEIERMEAKLRELEGWFRG
ncbi:hypothetical protein I314_01309 [Cryptococcus bacillisporus CA1873]|uniref:Protein YAE1 n=1 Tax=Cryptococcus bacillisporus CA1873 TaxID=1296111 RepID=A0ABR5BI97_CRYGA|nr:hypothetical protein I314_01309 [Cryptococcus bacillisporus CA1873]|eukprot:KIR68880.1 hypothetical protein I314_01309 [Cryptococcus gattii CA1873]